MIGLLVITHGKMAEGIMDSINLIMGSQENIDAVGLFASDDIERIKATVFNKAEALNQGEGVLIFADLYGASPFNSAGANLARFAQEDIQVRVISGVNLPMLLETINARNYMETLQALYKNALETGREGIRELLEDLGK